MPTCARRSASSSRTRCGHEKANPSHASEGGQAPRRQRRRRVARAPHRQVHVSDDRGLADGRGEGARLRLHARLESRRRASSSCSRPSSRTATTRSPSGSGMAAIWLEPARQPRGRRPRRDLRRVVSAEPRRSAAFPAEAWPQVHDAERARPGRHRAGVRAGRHEARAVRGADESDAPGAGPRGDHGAREAARRRHRARQHVRGPAQPRPLRHRLLRAQPDEVRERPRRRHGRHRDRRAQAHPRDQAARRQHGRRARSRRRVR